ncbi:hypothetical protein HBB16_03005 [Pseudonocardia sp. MCCB 268]|nr:hypothetical protein [Pseudonocardia cytotoxica]
MHLTPLDVAGLGEFARGGGRRRDLAEVMPAPPGDLGRRPASGSSPSTASAGWH